MAHDSAVNSVAFSPDGKYVVSGSDDGTARVWETSTGKEFSRMTFGQPSFNVASIAFNAGSNYVVAGGCDQVAKKFRASVGNKYTIDTYFPNQPAFNLSALIRICSFGMIAVGLIKRSSACDL